MEEGEIICEVVEEEIISIEDPQTVIAEEVIISMTTDDSPYQSIQTESKPMEEVILVPPKSKRQPGYTFTPLELPPCKVCNGKASGIHYGVNSCEACKGFFRRYLQRKEPYKCMKEGQCEITDRRRGNCSACRMQKCVMVGMSRDAVRQGRYTLTERTKTIMEVREIHERNMLSAGLDILAEAASQNRAALISESPGSCNTEKNNNNHGTDEASTAVSNIDTSSTGPVTGDTDHSYINSSERGQCDSFENIVTSGGSNPQKDILTPTDGKPFIGIDFFGCGQRQKSLFDAKIDLPRQCWPQVLSNLVSAMTNLTPLQAKSKEEIQAILEEGQHKYELQKQLFGTLQCLSNEEHQAIFEATGIDIDNRNKFFEDHNKTMTTLILGFIDFAKVIPGFMDLPVSDQASLLKESRFEFFMISSHEAFDPNTEIMMTYKGETYHMTQFCGFLNNANFRNWLQFTRKIKHFDFTQMEKALVLGITLTFRDRAHLENPDKVEEIQLWLIEQLMICFKLHHGKRCAEYFRKLIDMFIEFRNITEEFLQTHKKWKNDPIMRTRIPALGFFLFEDD
ncbi:nuclear receptor ROR-beta-like [Mytilus galloprovincialis]|uniref:nuclear receptor ROR-beta-like n=1 Tax=Mytilus galloprovincialis TaxID=29158 RepID=UPI003F7CA4EB